MAEPPLLELEGLSLRYATAGGDVVALDDFSLRIPRGGAVGLVGESGSGKSSVVLAVLGLLGAGATLTSRIARFDGMELGDAAPRLRGLRIGTVFQDPAASLNPALTIGLQVAEPLMTHRGMAREAALARAEALLAEVGIPRPGAVLRAYPHQLSGGMKQRAVIAGALACEPDLLLLDEPTTALDVTVEAQILDLLDELRARRGVSLLLVSHNLGIVDRVCDDLTVLYAGRVVEQGPAASLLAAPRHPYTRGLMGALPKPGRGRERLMPIPGGLPDLTRAEPGCNFAPRCGFAVAGCGQPQTLQDTGDGRAVRCWRVGEIGGAAIPPPQPSPAQERGRESALLPLAGEGRGGGQAPATTLLHATDLSRGFTSGGAFPGFAWRHGLPRLAVRARVRAVDGVSLHIARGEVLGVVGESGCGKTTLGRLLLRLIDAETGGITFDGVEVPPRPGTDFRRRAQIVFQNPDSSLNPRQTVAQILRRPLTLFGIAQGAAVEAEIDRLLALVRLSPAYRDRYPHQMSGGEKQRIGIARALASRPDFLVCDEAVSALDVSVQAAVLNLLADLRDELGVAYLFISHDIGVIGHIADRIAVMYRGAILEEGPADAVLAPPFHPYTEALLSAVPVPGLARAAAARRIRLRGDASMAAADGKGCRFAARCPRRLGAICDELAPPRREFGDGHRLDCHIPAEMLAEVWEDRPA